MYEANYWKTVCINKNVVLFLVIKNQSDNEQKQRDNKTTTVDSFERRQTVGIAGDRFLKKTASSADRRRSRSRMALPNPSLDGKAKASCIEIHTALFT